MDDSSSGSFLDGLIGSAQDVAQGTFDSVAQSAGDFIAGHVSEVTATVGPAPTGNLTPAQIAAGQTGQASGAILKPSGALGWITTPKGAGSILIPALLVIGAVYFLKGHH